MTNYRKMAEECMYDAENRLKKMNKSQFAHMYLVTELLAKARNYLDRAKFQEPGIDLRAQWKRLEGLRAERRKHGCT